MSEINMNESMQPQSQQQMQVQNQPQAQYQSQASPQQQMQMRQRPQPKTLYDTAVKENFHIFGLASFLYACLYAFCMYRNNSGVTYPFFVVGSIVFICYCLSKLGITWGKSKCFYMISMVLLSVSTFSTDDGRIIFFNKLGIFLLTISMLLSIVYNTKKWNLGKFLSSICVTCLMAIGEIYTPFADFVWYCKNKLDKKNCKYLYVLLGIVITIPLFLIVFALLSSADAVFRNMSDMLLNDLNFGDFILIGWMLFFMFVASYSIMVFLCKKSLDEEVKDSRKGEPLVAIPVATILSLLYLVFSVIQIVFLFMGNMQLPKGYTYAEYAREGFFQLLAVGILNLILVLVGLCYFRPNKVLKVVLAVMSGCTFIMLASSAMRMLIYIQYYYLTFLRILVLWSLVVLFLIFSGVIIYIFKDNFPLFRYSMVVVTCLYLVLSFSHPDYWIAKVNVAGSQESRSEFFKGECYNDYGLLRGLNTDAAPVMIQWMQEGGCDLEYYYECEKGTTYIMKDGGNTGMKMTQTQGRAALYYLENMRDRVGDITIRNFNISRFMADRMIEVRVKGDA